MPTRLAVPVLLSGLLLLAVIGLRPAGPISVSDSLTLTCALVDSTGTATDDLAQFRSDLDGILGAGHPDANGYFTVIVPPLSRGEHVISLWADFGQGLRQWDSYVLRNILPARIVSLPPQIVAWGVDLTWQASAEVDFVRYEIWRWIDDEDPADASMIGTIADRNVTTARNPLPPRL